MHGTIHRSLNTSPSKKENKTDHVFHFLPHISKLVHMKSIYWIMVPITLLKIPPDLSFSFLIQDIWDINLTKKLQHGEKEILPTVIICHIVSKIVTNMIYNNVFVDTWNWKYSNIRLSQLPHYNPSYWAFVLQIKPSWLCYNNSTVQYSVVNIPLDKGTKSQEKTSRWKQLCCTCNSRGHVRTVSIL